MTVADLRELLSRVDSNLPVLVEWCDASCRRALGGVVTELELDSRSNPPAFYFPPQTIEGSEMAKSFVVLV